MAAGRSSRPAPSTSGKEPKSWRDRDAWINQAQSRADVASSAKVSATLRSIVDRFQLVMALLSSSGEELEG
jgi:hypothetical protein